MGEWMKRHAEFQKKSCEQKQTVSVDVATKELLAELGIEFEEVKPSKSYSIR